VDGVRWGKRPRPLDIDLGVLTPLQVSTALAAGVILKALAQRPNFYSAAVYLSQSSANLMILTNLLFVVACSFLLGLQKLLYGNLRRIEIEQLYEKAWFAVTETCLAMTVFRGEIGLTFLAMFFSLLTGKVWGWIGEGRVEVLEQQPPRNPRLFHTRLALSLGLSVAFDLTMLEYVVKQVMRMARPDMMVMFGFEFAVLSIMSISTAMRYAINLVEIGIVREQKRHRIDEIKRERVQAAVTEFQESQNGRAAVPPPSDAGEATPTATPTQHTLEQVSQEALNQPVDENEVEVEGWEDKGRYMFYLNLATDFFKLVTYLAFFFILLVFYGLPIHILRDVFLTMRSFFKRISDFMKYRTATRDMNARYPDATAEEIGREEVCIICREEMHPYQPVVVEPGQPQPRPNPVVERMRPKKLPCGHVLHFSCLRSWLERQQICPTCRANVVRPGGAQTADAVAGEGGAGQANGGQHPPGARPGPRVYQFGPLRIGVGAARGNNMFEELHQQLGDAADPVARGQPQNPGPNAPRQFGVGLRWSRRRLQTENLTTQEQLDALEARIAQDLQELSHNSRELTVLRSMQAELQRLRGLRGVEGSRQANPTIQAPGPAAGLPPPRIVQRSTTVVPDNQQAILHAGSDRLPAGLTLPEGWTMMPLQPAHQVTHQQHHDGQVRTYLHQPLVPFAGMPMTPPRFQQQPFNVMPQPLFSPPVQSRPEPNTANNAPVGGAEINGAQSEPTGPQTQQPAAPLGGLHVDEVRFPWSPQWGMPTPEQLHQQIHQQQHELALARLRNQTGQEGATGTAGAGSIDLIGAASEFMPLPPDVERRLTSELLRRAEETRQPEAAELSSTQASSTPAPPLPAWGSSVPGPANGESSSDGASAATAEPQTNGHHDHDVEGTSQAASSSSQQPKNRHPTVEDLVEDPD
jgi:E3 ubiquitin-protein ligase synoviolin